MPHASHELAAALGYFSDKAEQDRPPRNRPLSLYATPYETVIVTEALTVATTTSFVWHNGSTGLPRMEWGVGRWQW